MHDAHEASTIASRRMELDQEFGPSVVSYLYDHLANRIDESSRKGMRSMTRRGISSDLEKGVVAALTSMGYSAQVINEDLFIEW